MSYLVDTNVVSELWKRERAAPTVVDWFRKREPRELYLSVLTVGELRRGAERLRARDSKAARALTVWLDCILERFQDRVLDVDIAAAERWGRVGVADPLPDIDGLVTATALARGLVVVMRNVRRAAPAGARYFNPFDGRSGP